MDLAVAGFAALVVGLLLPAIGLYESKGWDRGALQLYQQLANEAVDKRDGAAAGTYLRKLQALNEHGSETRYVTARLAEMNGQSNDVERLMHELRRWRDGVILLGHFWVATHLLRRARPIFSGTDHAARSSPQCGVASDHDRQAARILLADIERCAATGKQPPSIWRPWFWIGPRCVWPWQPSTRNWETCFGRAGAERAVEHFRRESCRDAGNTDAVSLWAKALAVGGDFELGEKVFLDALRTSNQRNRRRRNSASRH